MQNMIFTILKDDQKGKVIYLQSDEDVLISFPDESLCSKLYAYFTNPILVKMPLPLQEGITGNYTIKQIVPTDSLQNMYIALSELFVNLGVSVLWGTPPNKEDVYG